MSTKTIELIDPHEHAGRSYPPGSELTLDADAAEWLIALKKARPVAPAKPNTRTEPTKESAA